MGRCLSQEKIRDLLASRLAPPEAEVARAHVAGCRPCGEAVAAAARELREADEQRRQGAGDPKPGPAGHAVGGEGFSSRKRPRTFGHYRILEELGSGGQAIVYLAEDLLLPRRVALKVYSARAGWGPSSPRFEREAAALSRLNHPGICTIYEAGEIDDQPYLAMQYIEGETLDQRLKKAREQAARPAGTLVPGTPAGKDEEDVSELMQGRKRRRKPARPRHTGRTQPSSRGEIECWVAMFEKVARALHAAHETGLVHRDVKPSNILVNKDDEPVLLDFGMVQDESGGRVSLSGELLGTPAYMSPEQIAAQRIRLDRRTDVFSLGATFYEVLTGCRAFDAPTREGIYKQILVNDPPAARRMNPNIPRDLEVILETAIDKDRDRRYQTALELTEDLRRVRMHEPVRARPAGPVLRVRRWAQRNPLVAASLTALFTVMAAGLAVSIALLDSRKQALQELSAERDAKDKALAAERSAVTASGLALEAKATALREREATLVRSEGLRLLAHSTAVRPENPGLALLLAMEGTTRTPGLLANNALVAALEECQERRTLLSHHGLVVDARFSPDGRRVVTASWDQTARIWDPENGQELVRLVGHTAFLNTASFSPDGKRVVTTSDDRTARLWDAEKGKLLDTFLCPAAQRVITASFDADAVSVFTESADHCVHVWQVRGAREPVTFAGHTGKVLTVSCNLRRKRAVTASEDGTGRVWDAETGRALVALIGHGNRVLWASFSPDAERVVTGAADRTARIWETGTGRLLTIFKGHSQSVRSASFSLHQGWVLTSSDDRTARIWHASTGQEIAVFRGHTALIHSAQFSPDGKSVVTASQDLTARVWDTSSAHGGHVFEGHQDLIHSVSFSSDGQRLLTASWDGTARIWDVKSRKEVRVLRGHTGAVQSAVFSNDGALVVTAGSDKTARVWNAETGNQTRSFKGHEGAVNSASLSKDGRLLLTASSDRTARIWDARFGTQLFELRGHNDRVHSASFSPTGSFVITASQDATARLWDVSGTPRVVTILKCGDAVNEARFSPDGKRIVTSSWEHTVKIWDAEDGRPIRTLVGHTGGVRNAAFSLDGTRVVTASGDATTRIWDAENGKELLTLSDYGEVPYAACFSPDGQYVVTACERRSARLWPADALTVAQRNRPRELMPEEMELFEIGTVEARKGYAVGHEAASVVASLEVLLRQWRQGVTDTNLRGAVSSELREILKLWTTKQPSATIASATALVRSTTDLRVFLDDPHVGEALATMLWEASERAISLRLLEGLPQSPGRTWTQRLAKWRDELQPEMLTCGSIDAALDAPVSMIAEDAEWRFFKGRTEPSTDLEWTKDSFNDDDWSMGASGFGYGGEGARTTIDDMRGNFTTLYLRRRFAVEDVSRILRLVLRARVDDGLVAYLNGDEVGRVRAGDPGARLPFDATATNSAPEPPGTVDLEIDPRVLRRGSNCLAVQGLNRRSDSSEFELLPVLLSEMRPERARDDALLARFLGVAQGDSAGLRSRQRYLEGRLLQRQGNQREALARLEECLALDDRAPESHLRAAECRRAIGALSEAEARLRAVLGSFPNQSSIVDLWFLLACVDVKRSAAEASALLPTQDAMVDQTLLGELYWALERLAAGEGLFITCGGKDHKDERGRNWSTDRFFRSTGWSSRRKRTVHGTDAPELYQSETYFELDGSGYPGYRIPVPPGSYKITLGFAEIYYWDPGHRRFDVAIENKRVLEGYEPKVDIAESFSFDANVGDGFLDLELVHGKGNPKLSFFAIESEGH